LSDAVLDNRRYTRAYRADNLERRHYLSLPCTGDWREVSMKWNGHPNLARRPHAPNKGRGRLQRQVRRALLVHGPLVTTSQLLDWAYPRNRRRPSWDHTKVRRIVAEHCDRI